MKLLLKTLIALLLGMLITGAMLFLPAGTWDYPGAWLFMALLFTPVLLMGIVLMVKNPELLRKRLAMKEREKTQQGVIALSGLLLVASFIVAGIDYRCGWSHVSHGIVIIASAVLLIGYALYAEVLRENVYLSRTPRLYTIFGRADTAHRMAPRTSGYRYGGGGITTITYIQRPR